MGSRLSAPGRIAAWVVAGGAAVYLFGNPLSAKKPADDFSAEDLKKWNERRLAELKAMEASMGKTPSESSSANNASSAAATSKNDAQK